MALGAWNEQHCYPIAKDFREIPDRWWYMGDIPHGWACAELVLLIRDILFFEVGEDGDRCIFLAPGVMPHWLANGGSVGVAEAPTLFGGLFGYRLDHDPVQKRVVFSISQTPPGLPRYIYPCRFGRVTSATSDAGGVTVREHDVHLPAGTTTATIVYR